MAAPERVAAMMARRAAVNEIWRGRTGWPALALAGGDSDGRGGAGGGAGQFHGDHPGGVLLSGQGRGLERSMGPVDGPAPVIADLASFRVVSEPIHRQW